MSSPLSLKVRRLYPDAMLPIRADERAVGCDLFAYHHQTILPGRHALIKTGIAVAIPEEHYGRIAPRSGLALKNGIDVFAGVVDESYRGEVGVILFNGGLSALAIERGHRIAQLILERASIMPIVEVDSLDETVRGASGYGSSGL